MGQTLFASLKEDQKNIALNQCAEKILSLKQPDYDCHSSCLIETTPNRLLGIWKGAITKGLSNIDTVEESHLWMAIQEKGKWAPPKIIYTEKTSRMIWNPVLARFPDGEILLFFRLGPNPRQVIGMLMRSKDGGEIWTSPQCLPAGILGPSHSKPFITSNGTLLSGSSRENGNPEDKEKATACFIEISKDRGKSWYLIGPLEILERRFGALEPALVMDEQHHLRLFCRDRARRINELGWIWTSLSTDEGIHWGPLKKTSLPNPDSGIDAISLREGPILIAYNHDAFSQDLSSIIFII